MQVSAATSFCLNTSDKTDYFRCVGDDVRGQYEQYTAYVGMESTQHYCIDYSNGIPVFVRGTYSMVKLDRHSISQSADSQLTYL